MNTAKQCDIAIMLASVLRWRNIKIIGDFFWDGVSEWGICLMVIYHMFPGDVVIQSLNMRREGLNGSSTGQRGPQMLQWFAWFSRVLNGAFDWLKAFTMAFTGPQWLSEINNDWTMAIGISLLIKTIFTLTSNINTQNRLNCNTLKRCGRDLVCS